MARTHAHHLIIVVLPDVASTPGLAATVTVSKMADTNGGSGDADCSLHEPITAANVAAGEVIITFAASNNGSPLVVASNLPGCTAAGGNVTFTGNAASNTITDGNTRYRQKQGPRGALAALAVAGGRDANASAKVKPWVKYRAPAEAGTRPPPPTQP